MDGRGGFCGVLCLESAGPPDDDFHGTQQHSCRLTAALFLPNPQSQIPQSQFVTASQDCSSADASQSHRGADVSRAKERLSTDLSPLIGTTVLGIRCSSHTKVK